MQLTRIDQQPAWDALCPEWKIIPTAAPQEKIEITAERPLVAPGETIRFFCRFLREGQAVAGVPLELQLIRDFHRTETIHAVSSADVVSLQTSLEKPGFVRLAVTGGNVSATLGVGCNPTGIIAAPEVDGFMEFWEAQKKRLHTVPVEELRCEEVPLDDPSYQGVKCFDVQVACAGNAPVSAMLALPSHAKPHSLPGYVFFHGAGVRRAFQPLPWAQRGMLALNVNAHGLPNGADDAFYRQISEGILKEYQQYTYEKPEDSLFCSMVLRVLRALEYLKSRPEWDGRTLVVHGGSQGGFQALAAAALDCDVTFGVYNAPALCNLAGSLEGRTTSWPFTVYPEQDKTAIHAALFCDGASFARHAVKAEGVFTVGFSDTAAVPSSVYAAYNVYPSVKSMLDFPDLGHETSVFWTADAEIAKHVQSMKTIYSKRS